MLLLSVAACGGSRKKASLPANALGTPAARQAQYMSFLGRSENVPTQIRHEAVRDEATLVSIDTQQACFQVIVRTAIDVDEPVDELSPQCKGQGFKTQAAVVSETVSVVDYPYTGERVIMTAQGVVASEFVKMQLTEPAERTFRVIERAAALCCPTAGYNDVSLTLSNGRMQTPIAPFSAKFSWTVM